MPWEAAYHGRMIVTMHLIIRTRSNGRETRSTRAIGRRLRGNFGSCRIPEVRPRACSYTCGRLHYANVAAQSRHQWTQDHLHCARIPLPSARIAIKNVLFRSMEQIAGGWTDYLVVINRCDERAALKHNVVPRERLVYMPGIGIDLERYDREKVVAADLHRVRSELKLSAGDDFFLMVAEFTPGKRHADALQAFSDWPIAPYGLCLQVKARCWTLCAHWLPSLESRTECTSLDTEAIFQPSCEPAPGQFTVGEGGTSAGHYGGPGSRDACDCNRYSRMPRLARGRRRIDGSRRRPRGTHQMYGLATEESRCSSVDGASWARATPIS